MWQPRVRNYQFPTLVAQYTIEIFAKSTKLKFHQKHWFLPFLRIFFFILDQLVPKWPMSVYGFFLRPKLYWVSLNCTQKFKKKWLIQYILTHLESSQLQLRFKMEKMVRIRFFWFDFSLFEVILAWQIFWAKRLWTDILYTFLQEIPKILTW